MRSPVTFALSCALLVVCLSGTAEAQCADGSAPPCRARVRADTNVFVVLPFVVRGPPAMQYPGESVVDLLHMALDGVGGMRIEYAPSVVRQVSSLPQPQDARSAAALATELGAARLIGGTIVALGSEVRIRAEIHDALRGRTQFAVEGRASIDSVGAVVDSLASAILARRLLKASERHRLGDYATRSADALQAYLVAKQHIRRGQRRAASDSLKVAIQRDSNFGLAHLWLHRIEASEGGITGIPAHQLLRTALDRRHRFPERVRLLLDARDAAAQQLRGQALAMARAAAARYPNDPDVAFLLADVNFHYGINLGEPRRNVIAMFRHALSLDDFDPELINHVGALAAEEGDTAAIMEFDRYCRGVELPVCRVSAAEPGFRAIFSGEDPRRIAVGADSLFWGGPANFLMRIGASNVAFNLAITDSFASIQTAPGRERGLRAQAFLVRSNVALARGQHTRAWEFLDSASLASGQAYGQYRLLTGIVTRTRGADLAALPINRASFLQVMNRAWWMAMSLPVDSAATLIPELEGRPWPEGTLTASVAAGLRGLIVLRRGDSLRARELLVQARSTHKRFTVPNRIVYPGAYLALTLAQLEAAIGSPAQARAYLADVYPVNDYVPFIGDTEELRADIALALGDTATARVALRNVVAVWKDADPKLQPRVARACATLARLDTPARN